MNSDIKDTMGQDCDLIYTHHENIDHTIAVVNIIISYNFNIKK